MWKIATGIENAAILPYNGYYYMFGSKGLCCSGVNSTYYTIVARADSITGPYYDANGTAMTSSGGTMITYGVKAYTDEIGPGGADWFQVGSDYYMVHHFYDGANNGYETFNIRKILFENGWLTVSKGIGSGGAVTPNTPDEFKWVAYEGQTVTLDGKCEVAFGTQGSYVYLSGKTGTITFNSSTFGSDPFPGQPKFGYIRKAYKIVNRNSGNAMDGMGYTTAGSDVCQYDVNSSDNQLWYNYNLGNGYYKIVNKATGLRLDGMGRTTDGSIASQYTDSSSYNQQWSLQWLGGGYWKVVNRATGKCLDTGGQTGNGNPLQQWYSNSSYNQQWTYTGQ